MKPILLPVAELKSALLGLGKVINSRASLPLLRHIKVERTSDGWIALTATDLDRFVTMRLEHPAEGQPTAVLVPFDQLQQLTKNCGKGESLIIDTSHETPVIRFALANNLGASKIKPLPVAEFPTTPRIKADGLPLPPELRRSIHEAMECASTDQTRYVLNGAFIDTSNPRANYIVGTDGRSLYSSNSFTLPLKKSVIIPSHKFLHWKEFNLDGEWQMKADETHVQLSSRRWRFITRQIEGKYPDWRQVIANPTDAKTFLTLDPAKLETLIKLIQRLPCHDEKYGTLGLEWQKDQLHLLAKENPNDEWLRVPVPDVKGKGSDITIFVDRRYMCRALDYGLNAIDLIDEITALRFHNQGRQMVIMPVRSARPAGDPDPQPAAAKVHPTPAPSPKPQPMTSTHTSPPPAPSSDAKTPVEEAIDMTFALRDKLNDGFNLLRDLSLKLKDINRTHKTSAKEFNNLRSTLRSLQGIKL